MTEEHDIAGLQAVEALVSLYDEPEIRSDYMTDGAHLYDSAGQPLGYIGRGDRGRRWATGGRIPVTLVFRDQTTGEDVEVPVTSLPRFGILAPVTVGDYHIEFGDADATVTHHGGMETTLIGLTRLHSHKSALREIASIARASLRPPSDYPDRDSEWWDVHGLHFAAALRGAA